MRLSIKECKPAIYLVKFNQEKNKWLVVYEIDQYQEIDTPFFVVSGLSGGTVSSAEKIMSPIVEQAYDEDVVRHVGYVLIYLPHSIHMRYHVWKVKKNDCFNAEAFSTKITQILLKRQN